jgi:hypothetical protein
MIPEKMLELLILTKLEDLSNHNPNFDKWVEDNYNIEKINERYLTLMKEFLTPYAKSNAEKSD